MNEYYVWSLQKISPTLKQRCRNGQDYSLSGITGRKLVGGQNISLISDPSCIISVLTKKTDAFGKFGVTTRYSYDPMTFRLAQMKVLCKILLMSMT